MADTYDGPFAGVADVTEIVSAAANTAIQAEITKIKDLIPDPTANDTATKPDFDEIPPHTASKLRAEIDALIAAVAAAPTA